MTSPSTTSIASSSRSPCRTTLMETTQKTMLRVCLIIDVVIRSYLQSVAQVMFIDLVVSRHPGIFHYSVTINALLTQSSLHQECTERCLSHHASSCRHLSIPSSSSLPFYCDWQQLLVDPTMSGDVAISQELPFRYCNTFVIFIIRYIFLSKTIHSTL